MVFIAGDEAAEPHHPGEETLDVPATPVAAEWSSVLREPLPPRVVRRDHLDTELGELRIQRIAIVRTIADEPLRKGLQESSAKGVEDELRFSSLTRRSPDGDRKTMAVCHCHDLGRLAAASFSNIKAPLLAPAWVPSMNASVRSSLPRS